MAAELFRQKAEIEFIHVPYKGAAQALTYLLGERLDLMFPSLSLAQGFIATDKLRVLGIASEQRSSLAPDIPTIAETGLPGFATSSWSGIVAPAGTSDAVVLRLENAIRDILEKEDVKEFFKKQGLDRSFRGRQAFVALIGEELGNWSRNVGKPKDN